MDESESCWLMEWMFEWSSFAYQVDNGHFDEFSLFNSLLNDSQYEVNHTR